jgi:hypothetical protein
MKRNLISTGLFKEGYYDLPGFENVDSFGDGKSSCTDMAARFLGASFFLFSLLVAFFSFSESPHMPEY